MICKTQCYHSTFSEKPRLLSEKKLKYHQATMSLTWFKTRFKFNWNKSNSLHHTSFYISGHDQIYPDYCIFNSKILRYPDEGQNIYIYINWAVKQRCLIMLINFNSNSYVLFTNRWTFQCFCQIINKNPYYLAVPI